MSSGRRSLRLRKISLHTLANDPIAKLPDLCIDAIFSYFSPTELIGIQRVSKTWRDHVNWCFSRVMYRKRWFPPLGTDSDVEYGRWEDAAVAFRRAVYRHEMRKRGEPTFIRKFTNAHQGWAVCGDYFVWIDANFINVQLVFDIQNPGRMVRPIQRYSLRKLFRHERDGANHIRMLDVQETGGVGEQPLLALIILNQASASPFPISKVAVMDVVKGQVLWCLEDPKHSVYHCTLNRSVLSYVQYPYPAYDAISGERLPPSLVVLDVLTGALKSSTKLNFERNSSSEVRAIRAHPCRKLIFVLLRNQIMVFSTNTMDWVSVLKLLVVSTSDDHPLGNSPGFLSGSWEFQFDENEPKSGAPDKVSVCGLRCQFPEPGPSRMNYFVIQSFELPSTEEPVTAITEATKNKLNKEDVNIISSILLEPTKTWKRLPIEILDATDVMTHTMMGPEVNIRAKQVAVMLPSSNLKSSRAIIYTYKEEMNVPGTFVVSAASGRESSVGKGKDEEAGVKFRWFTPSVKSEVTKIRKNLLDDTPYVGRRMPASFPGVRGFKGPQLRERYMVFDQRTDVFLLSFSPVW